MEAPYYYCQSKKNTYSKEYVNHLHCARMENKKLNIIVLLINFYHI